MLGTLGDLLSGVLTQSAPGENGIWNLKASEGLSLIAGLGAQPSAALPVHIEAAPGLSQDRLNRLLDASGVSAERTLEAALDVLRRIILGPAAGRTAVDDREALHAHLQALQDDAAYAALKGNVQISVLAGATASDLKGMGLRNDALGLATRYALQALNPFALVGADYSAFNAKGELDLFDSATGNGDFTPHYLTDRADFLARRLWFSAEDIELVNPTYGYDGADHPYLRDAVFFEDAATGDKIA